MKEVQNALNESGVYSNNNKFDVTPEQIVSVDQRLNPVALQNEQVDIGQVENLSFENNDVSESYENLQQSQSQDGPKLTKTLGERPMSNSGFSNWFSIVLFLSVDIIAIIVGVYLLIR